MTRPIMHKKLSLAATLSGLTLLLAPQAQADSVAQIATAVRISRATAAQIDPQGRPDTTTAGSATAVKKGDVLTFVAAFTPVPNGGFRGLGGYVTVYIPRNTEVVSARMVDRDGNTVAPHRGGLAAEGLGPNGATDIVGTKDGGSMSQLYADTGIFYSTDPLTTRVPDGSLAGGTEVFLLVSNGIEINPLTTAFGQLDDILGATKLYAHNTWDAVQAHAFGTASSPYSNSGRGNTLHLYGSPVAGSDSFYTYAAKYSGGFSPFVYGSLSANSSLGPWQRIQTVGGEIGRIVAHNPPSAMQAPGTAMRVGKAAATDGVPDGRILNGVSPLPAFSASAPSAPYTRALRFAVGELIVGQDYFSEFSLRVLDTPLDPTARADVVCAEVFGGDASSEGAKDGKDNAWRYFLPAPACVSLNLLFDLDVSQRVALKGNDLVYTITTKNLTTEIQHAAVVRYCYSSAEETFLSASAGHAQQISSDCPDPTAQNSVYWNVGNLDPGEEVSYQLTFDAVQGGKGDSIVARAVYRSQETPLPGFQTVAFTVVDDLAVPELSLTVTPNAVPNATANGKVRYTATIANTGTGVAGCGAGCSVTVALPSGFTYASNSLSVNGVKVASNGTQTGNSLVFTANLAAISVGGTLKLSFDVNIAGATPAGEYTSGLEIWLSDVGGQRVNDAAAGLAKVVVNTTATPTPAAPKPPAGGDTKVCGVAQGGSVVRVYVAGIAIASGTADATGKYCVLVPALSPGQAVGVSAQSAGKVESDRSAELIVAGFTSGAACDDGLDNDGDGKKDFPEDPGCTSKADTDEAFVPQCADGIDQDRDTKIDLDDEGCSSLLDDSEGGEPACNDGTDNDGDSKVDTADPGCDGSTDSSELDVSACSDGMDNDGDKLTDFPLDPGCASAADDDETNSTGGGADGGMGNGANTGATSGGDSTSSGGGTGGSAGESTGTGATGSGAGGDTDAAVPTDLGGVDEPGDGGCSVRTASVQDAGHGWLLAGLLAFAWRRRRRGPSGNRPLLVR